MSSISRGSAQTSPTPGANLLRQQAFDRIYKKAAELVVQGLELDLNSFAQIRAFAEGHAFGSDPFMSVFADFDSRMENSLFSKYSLASGGDRPTETFNASFMAFKSFIRSELKFGAGNEDVDSMPDVRLEDVAEVRGNPAELFSYQGQCRLVRLILPAVQVPEGGAVDDPGASLCEQLFAAQEMELRGALRNKQQKLDA
ncbi:MAG: hypothetical protein L0Z53_05940, partial [Acidobacteriales bacterium]|nr:hypothetical protein [Terriglobales bacterium]